MPESPPEYRFFLDYDEETESVNVFAAVTNYGLYGENSEKWTGEAGEPVEPTYAGIPDRGREMEGFGAVFFRDNSATNWTGAAREFVGPELPKAVARKLHPRLFERIEGAKEGEEKDAVS